MCQSKSAAMCQSKSAGTFQGKNAVMYQNKSAGMYPSKNVAMYPSKSVGMYRSKNAAMYQSKSAKMYPNKSAGTYRSKNARTYPSKSARNSASRYCGVKYALDGGTLLFCIFVNASERRKSSMTINDSTVSCAIVDGQHYLLAPTGALIVIVCYYWSARQAIFSDFEHFCPQLFERGSRRNIKSHFGAFNLQ